MLAIFSNYAHLYVEGYFILFYLQKMRLHPDKLVTAQCPMYPPQAHHGSQVTWTLLSATRLVHLARQWLVLRTRKQEQGGMA